MMPGLEYAEFRCGCSECDLDYDWSNCILQYKKPWSCCSFNEICGE